MFGVKNEKKFSAQKTLGIRNCIGRSTESMVGNYCVGIRFFQKIVVKKAKFVV